MKLHRRSNPLHIPKHREKTGKLIKCFFCGKEKYFRKAAIRKRNFCSRQCFGLFNKGRTLSLITRRKIAGRIGKASATYKDGRTITSAGYVLVLAHGHPNAKPNNYIFEHRLVMENKLGRYLTSEEHVHHINFNKADNRVSNLAVMSNAEHRKLHRSNNNNRSQFLHAI